MPDYRVERLTSAGRRSVETSDVGPVAGLGEMLGDQTEMPGLVEEAPAGDSLGRQTSVREGDDERRARLQHARNLANDFARTREILDRAAQCRAVEFGIGKRQHRV